MTDLYLGDAIPSDFAAFPGLLAQLGYPSEPATIAPRVDRVRAGGGRVIVARRGETVLGLMTLAFIPLVHHDGGLCRVSALVVAGHARGRGIGRRLMALAEQIAREHQCSRVEVTSAEHRVSAHAFYRSLGYAERPRRFVKQLVEPHDVASSCRPAAQAQPSPHSPAPPTPQAAPATPGAPPSESVGPPAPTPAGRQAAIVP